MKIIKKYDQYIKGNLTEEKMETFTKEVVQEYFEKEKLQNKWNQILQEEQHSQKVTAASRQISAPKKSRKIISIGLAAAASILLFMFSWLAYQSSSVSSYEKLLSEELNKPFIESLSRKGDVEELKLQAVAAYNSRSYATAEAYFKQINTIDEAVDWNFYIGLCQLYQEQADLAIQSFTATLEHPNKKYNIETNWYLGLAYTMNENFKAAKTHLQFVANRSDDNMAWKVTEAKALLKALDENN